MSGNEKSNSEDENPIRAKKSLSKEKNKNNNVNVQTKKLSKNNNNINVINEKVNDKLYKQNKFIPKVISKKTQNESNTDYNNKRFEKNKIKYSTDNNGIIKEENIVSNNNKNIVKNTVKPNINVFNPSNSANKINNLNFIPVNSSNKENLNKKINARYIIDEHLKLLDEDIFQNEEEDEEIKNVPRPIINKNSKVKLNDFKTIKTASSTSNNQNIGSQLYMPDFKASKLVDEILHRKLNE